MKLISPFSVMLLAVKNKESFNLDKLSLLHLVEPSASTVSNYNPFK